MRPLVIFVFIVTVIITTTIVAIVFRVTPDRKRSDTPAVDYVHSARRRHATSGGQKMRPRWNIDEGVGR